MTMPLPTVSVVVCTRNRMTCLVKCLVSLLKQSVEPKEIIIVDDASEEKDFVESINSVSAVFDGSVAGTSIIYLRNGSRQGTTKSRNLGTAVSSGKVVAFIDDDGYAHPDWLKKLVLNYRRKSVIAVGGPVVEAARADAKKSSRCLSRITSRGDIIHNYRLKREDDAGSMKSSSARFLMGGNMSFRRKALVKLHGFDPRFKGNAYREETDMCLRASQKGRIIFEPQAIAYHDTAKDGGTRDVSTVANFLYWYFRNTTILFFRHFDFFDAAKKVYFQSKKFIDLSITGGLKINRSYLAVGNAKKYMTAIARGIVSGFFNSWGKIKKLDYEYPEDIKMLNFSAANSRLQFAESRNFIRHTKLFIRCYYNGGL